MANSVVGRQAPPPLRAEPGAPDRYDGQRIEYYYHGCWRAQDAALRSRDRQIEENVRMLCGQQWNVFNPIIGKFYDISEWMTDAERRWRQRPVINRLLLWFILTHARLTENPPILTFLPGPDALDAELAEVMDTAFKIVWREANMEDVVDRLYMWLVCSGRGHLISRIDLTKGPWRPWTGQAQVPLAVPGPDGHQPLMGPDGAPQLVGADSVPMSKQGQPLAMMDAESGTLVHTGQPHAEREGQIVVDVASPLEVRGQWGPMPWQDKSWHGKIGFLSPEQVYELWGIELEPDTTYEQSGAGILDRLMFGTGFYGAATGRFSSGLGGTQEARDGLCTILEIWERPNASVAGMQEDPTTPGGRHIILTPRQVIRDGPREVAYPYVSPIRTFDFVRVPGRPNGTSPQEAMNGPQRSYNKLRAQIMEHANLVSNPKYVIDQASNIDEGQWTNEPGTGVRANRRTGVPAVEWITPPALGDAVYKALAFAKDEIEDLGYLKGTQGEPLSADQSGEAIKELRFNSDRFLGPTQRRAVSEFGRMAEDWKTLMAVIYDEERILTYTGTDNIAKTITVLPEMFEQGKVHVVPDVESMLPEGRGERQAQVYKLWQDGAFGAPLDPAAIRKFLELGRFPNISRTAKPGGPDAVTAEQENGKLAMGSPAAQIPVLPWYDSAIHLQIHEAFMKAPEFLKLDPQVQQQFIAHRAEHIQALQAQAPMGPPGAGGPPHPMPPGAHPPMAGAPHHAGPPVASTPIQPPQPQPPASVPPGQMPTALPSQPPAAQLPPEPVQT